MSEPKEPEAENEHQPVTVDSAKPTSGLTEVERIHRKGGCFVGVVGWSGNAFYLIRIILGFLVAGILWAVIAALSIVFDETVRMGVRKLLDATESTARVVPESVPNFAIRESPDYQKLSTKWKQLFAEVQLNHSDYAPRLIRILNDMTLADIAKIDGLAPYVVENSILRSNEGNSQHAIPGLSFLDFARLKTIGILQQGQLGQQIKVQPRNGQPATVALRGTTLALRVEASDATAELSIPLTRLTEEGILIVRLLDRATSLAGVCTSATRFDAKKYTTQIWARFASRKKPWSDQAEVREVTSLCAPNSR